MLMGCKTCPSVEEPAKYLTVNPVPELVLFESSNTELDKTVKMQAELYTYIYKLLLTADATGLFTDDIQEDISFSKDVLDWIADKFQIDERL